MANITQEILSVCIVQGDIFPDKIEETLQQYQKLLEKKKFHSDIIFFPELFSSGFSPNISHIAKTESKKSLQFLQKVSLQYQADVAASIAIEENGKLYNRIYWLRGEEVVSTYDKRHLFLGYEKETFSQGKTTVISECLGWNFSPFICYDIRFPVWIKNSFQAGKIKYDSLVFFANFPTSRMYVFTQLAIARAIENQCYVFAVNRIGVDGYHHQHSGSSLVVDPRGKIIAQAQPNTAQILEVEIRYSFLDQLRKIFPVFKDWDSFAVF